MKSLNDYTQDAQTNALDKAGAFFAFSNRQLEEKRQEGVVYVNMGLGLVCPKPNAHDLFKELREIHSQGYAGRVPPFRSIRNLLHFNPALQGLEREVKP